jgi:hypothetical protein
MLGMKHLSYYYEYIGYNQQKQSIARSIFKSILFFRSEKNLVLQMHLCKYRFSLKHSRCFILEILLSEIGVDCDMHPEVLAYIGERNLLLSEKENGARLFVTEGMPDRAL